MSELKTRPNDKPVSEYLDAISPENRKKDCLKIYELMKKVVGEEGKMWGDSIIGFGSYHYVYDSGREGDWMLTGFSSRARNISIYIMSGFDAVKDEMKELGKFTTGKSCLYVKKLEDIDLNVLEKVIRRSNEVLKKRYG